MHIGIDVFVFFWKRVKCNKMHLFIFFGFVQFLRFEIKEIVGFFHNFLDFLFSFIKNCQFNVYYCCVFSLFGKQMHTPTSLDFGFRFCCFCFSNLMIHESWIRRRFKISAIFCLGFGFCFGLNASQQVPWSDGIETIPRTTYWLRYVSVVLWEIQLTCCWSDDFVSKEMDKDRLITIYMKCSKDINISVIARGYLYILRLQTPI